MFVSRKIGKQNFYIRIRCETLVYLLKNISVTKSRYFFSKFVVLAANSATTVTNKEILSFCF